MGNKDGKKVYKRKEEKLLNEIARFVCKNRVLNEHARRF